MLSQEDVRTLGFKGKFYHKISTPNFGKPTPLWFKGKTQSISNVPEDNIHQFCYYKTGKTFGFETKRYIEYRDGTLFYYDGQKDQEHRGFCDLTNIYLFYIKIDDKFLLHLTNGNEYSQFFFKDNSFFKMFSSQIFKKVVQLNFDQKYLIDALIGKGTFSKVYEARNKFTSRRVAVKIIYKKDKNGQSTKNIVEEQKKMMGMVSSKYICNIEEFFETNDSYILVLQYIEGKDLMHIIKNEEDLSIRTVISILTKILQGINQCHKAKIIHRDLKPQNILIKTNKKNQITPKIIDFGLSLSLNLVSDHKKFKRCGTIGYMAYEVIRNTSDKKQPYDYKVDMFSFGIIAHMFLLGYNPLKGQDYEETFLKNYECNIQFNKQIINQQYGKHALQFFTGLLQNNPAKRFSAEQALEAQFLSKENLEHLEIMEQKYNKQKEKMSQIKGTISTVSSHLHNLSEGEATINPKNLKSPKINSLAKKNTKFIK